MDGGRGGDYRKGWSLPARIDPNAVEVQTVELDSVGWFVPDAPPDLEDEAYDVLTLHAQVAAGGSRLLVR